MTFYLGIYITFQLHSIIFYIIPFVQVLDCFELIKQPCQKLLIKRQKKEATSAQGRVFRLWAQFENGKKTSQGLLRGSSHIYRESGLKFYCRHVLFFTRNFPIKKPNLSARDTFIYLYIYLLIIIIIIFFFGGGG